MRQANMNINSRRAELEIDVAGAFSRPFDVPSGQFSISDGGAPGLILRPNIQDPTISKVQVS